MPALRVPGGLLPLAGLVLDKDGVLQDFNASWLPVLRARAEAVAAALGAPELAEALALAMGADPSGQVRPEGILAMGTAAEAQAAAACEAHRHGFPWAIARAAAAQGFAEAARACPPGTEALPGALEAIRALRASGFRLALCTSDGPEGTQAFLGRHALTEAFDAVSCADGNGPGKPHPAALRQVAERMGLPLAGLAMVGDTPADLRMARRAGAALALGVMSGVGSSEALRPWADWLLPALRDLPQAAVA